MIFILREIYIHIERDRDTEIYVFIELIARFFLGPLLLTRINFNPSMENPPHAQQRVGWNFSFPNFNCAPTPTPLDPAYKHASSYQMRAKIEIDITINFKL